MKYSELLQSQLLQLPKSVEPKLDFLSNIRVVLSQYLSLINDLENTILEFDGGQGVDTEFIKKAQNYNVKKLINTIEAYYDGFPSKAYSCLENAINNEYNDFAKIIKQTSYPVNENFYRIRTKEDNFPFEVKDMLHVPFEKRGAVRTQRFSIPGFPCLYLGRTLYVCWEELNRPNINSLQAVRFRNVEALNLLDLTFPNITSNDLFSYETYKYIIAWPLIACCSFKVENLEDVFKPEYIVPQLLLQWVRNTGSLDGIIYRSNRIPLNNSNLKGEFSNLVLPVKKIADNGHCINLKAIFESTEVVSKQIHEVSLGGEFFMKDNGAINYINEKLPRIELIRGKKYPYSYSALGKLEYYLDRMETQTIDSF